MGPTPEQTDALKAHVSALNNMVNATTVIDWSQVVQLIMQLLKIVISSHVK